MVADVSAELLPDVHGLLSSLAYYLNPNVGAPGRPCTKNTIWQMLDLMKHLRRVNNGELQKDDCGEDLPYRTRVYASATTIDENVVKSAVNWQSVSGGFVPEKRYLAFFSAIDTNSEEEKTCLGVFCSMTSTDGTLYVDEEIYGKKKRPVNVTLIDGEFQGPYNKKQKTLKADQNGQKYKIKSFGIASL